MRQLVRGRATPRTRTTSLPLGCSSPLGITPSQAPAFLCQREIHREASVRVANCTGGQPLRALSSADRSNYPKHASPCLPPCSQPRGPAPGPLPSLPIPPGNPFPLATGPATHHSGLGSIPPLQRGRLTQRYSLSPAPVLILCPKCLTVVYFFLIVWFIISIACKLPESRLSYLSHSLLNPPCLEQYPGHRRN